MKEKTKDRIYWFMLFAVPIIVVLSVIGFVWQKNVELEDDSLPDVVWWRPYCGGGDSGDYHTYTSYVNCTGTQPQPGNTEWPLR